MNEELDNILIELVEAIDLERDKLKEEFKKNSQYKRTKKYRLRDEAYLDKLLTQRNTLVSVINYIRTKDKNRLADIDFKNSGGAKL